MENKELDTLIVNLKKDFNGSSDYLSGVNDGMYHFAHNVLLGRIDTKDLIIEGIEEGSEQWKAEYDNCRAILQELVDLKIMKDAFGGEGSRMENQVNPYAKRKPLAWEAAKAFLEKYQHL